jgi:hypothetical protein
MVIEFFLGSRAVRQLIELRWIVARTSDPAC